MAQRAIGFDALGHCGVDPQISLFVGADAVCSADDDIKADERKLLQTQGKSAQHERRTTKEKGKTICINY